MGLILKNLAKSFENKIIFNGFSYNFDSVGIYAIVGDSGVGKTTLLRMIAGLDENYRGEILGGGIANVSYAFQEHRLFPELCALENAVIANGDMKDDSLVKNAKELLFTLGFAEKDLSLLPNELSGGMKQRVSLVRAFLRKKPILLLDEPTKELDVGIINSLYKLIKTEAERRAVIIVSHHSEDIENLGAVQIKI